MGEQRQQARDTQRAALGVLVKAIAGLDTSLYWGEGKTSASDGQRYSLRRKVLQKTYSPRFSDFALEFYSFVADNYAPFFSTPIECTDRDAATVLDGLLTTRATSSLRSTTRTPTATPTSILPRSRCSDVASVRGFGASKSSGSTGSTRATTAFSGASWAERIGRSTHEGSPTNGIDSVALRRLAGFSAKNGFYRANRDLGRILKTEFILQYMSEPALRTRIRRGLLKVEQMHALARDLFYGNRGRINARDLWEQMNSCSCLTLIVACIIYWQAKDISRVIRTADPERHGIELSLLRHVSPIEWDNIVLYGEYVLNRRLVRRSRSWP